MLKFKSIFISAIICLNNFSESTGGTDDLIDVTCSSNLDCLQFLLPQHNATCIDDKCVCYGINSEVVKCIPPDSFVNNIIGGKCPCTQLHAECDTKQDLCFCRKGFTATADKRRCIKRKLSLGEMCEDDSQCIYQEKFSECNPEEKICKCQKDFVEFNKGCISVVGLNESCEENSQCSNHTNNSICTLRKCVCQEGFVANLQKTLCIPSADHGEQCLETNQCKNKLGVGSMCYSGRCSCDSNHKLLVKKLKDKKFHNYCEKIIEFGTYCLEHNDCYQVSDAEQKMECFLGECRCRVGYNNRNSTCVENGTETLRFNLMFTFLLTIICFLITSWSNSIQKI